MQLSLIIKLYKENSEIIATAINGNSDKSEEVKVLMPIKEITPLAPLLETNFKSDSFYLTSIECYKTGF